MQTAELSHTLHDLDRAFDGQEFELCLRLAQFMRVQILHGQANPIALGWARFYEFKSLYQLKRYQEALAQLDRDEPIPFAQTHATAAWLFSAGADVAQLLHRPEDLVRYAGRALEFRLSSENPLEAFRCAYNACHWLARLNRDDLNSAFAWFQMRIGRSDRVANVMTEGIIALCDNIAQSASVTEAARLIQWLAWHRVHLNNVVYGRVVRTIYAVLPGVSAPLRWLWAGYLALHGRPSWEVQLN